MINKNKKIIIFITTIVLLIVVCLLGYTYGYLESNVIGNDSSSNDLIKSPSTNGLEVSGTEAINFSANPGDVTSFQFSVYNHSDSTISGYEIYASDVKNNFYENSEVVYSISCSSNNGVCDDISSETVFPISSKLLFSQTTPITTNTTHTYTIYIKYIKLNTNQAYNVGKSISFKISINTAVVNFAEYLIDNSQTYNLVQIKDVPYGNQNYYNNRYYNQSRNLVNFNGGQWDIIGVFEVDNGSGVIENRVKLVKQREDNFSWDNQGTADGRTNDYGNNIWSQSRGRQLLNPGYESEIANNSLFWNSDSGSCYAGNNSIKVDCDFTSNGLKDSYKEYIDNAVWYLGAVTQNYYTAYQVLQNEKLNGQTYNAAEHTWTGKVGFPYLSDIMFLSNSCYQNTTINNWTECSRWFNNWNYWTITTDISYNSVWRIGASGVLELSAASSKNHFLVSVYLKADVKYLYGDGTLASPFTISL